jgi:hypothetical protein
MASFAHTEFKLDLRVAMIPVSASASERPVTVDKLGVATLLKAWDWKRLPFGRQAALAFPRSPRRRSATRWASPFIGTVKLTTCEATRG